ncbi:uncharacterized protein [Ambystoma mexicanum]|uniref:uncharacterized protein isoform X2 n=1 Tax=Ambystoma mexicanum TaxID=8296 RepID=UPI0037E839DF
MGGSRDNCKTLRKRQPYHKERKNELGRPAANAKSAGSSRALLKAMREVSDLCLGGSEFQDFGASTSKLSPLALVLLKGNRLLVPVPQEHCRRGKWRLLRKSRLKAHRIRRVTVRRALHSSKK